MESNKFEKIVGLMQLKGISKEQFLNDLQIDENMFNARAQGMPISDEELLKISNYLGVTFDFFTMDDGTSAPKKRYRPKYDSKVMQTVNDLYDEAYEEKHKNDSSKIFNNDDLSDGKKKFSAVLTIISLIIFIAFFIYICTFVTQTNSETMPTFTGFLVVFGIIIGIIVITTLVKLFKKK